MTEDALDPTKDVASPSTRIPESRFSTQVAGTFGVRLLMVGNSVIAGIIVARWLGVEGLGQLAVINVAVATIVQFGSAGLPSANTYFIAQDKSRLVPVAINSFLFALTAGAVLAVGLCILALVRPGWFGFVPTNLVAIAAVSIPFQLITVIGLNIFLALGRIDSFNLFDLLGQAFVLINALMALIILSSGLWTLVSFNTVASIAMGLLIIALVVSRANRQADRKAWRADGKLFSSMLRYGIKFHISILVGALIFRADLLVVNYFRGPAEAGVYSVASQVGLMLMLLPGVVGTLLFPRVTAAPDQSGVATCRVTRHTAFVMLFVCLAAIPLSYLLPVLYGAAFNNVVTQLWILLPGIYLIGLESVLVQHSNALGLPRAIPIFWIITLLVNIVLVFALVPRFGAPGAALASTLSYVLIFLLVTFHFHATTGTSFSDTFVMHRSELKRLLRLREIAGAPR